MRVFGFGKDAMISQYHKIAKWLHARPELYKGKKIERYDQNWNDLAKILKAAGFYSKKTSTVDINIPRILKFVARV